MVKVGKKHPLKTGSVGNRINKYAHIRKRTVIGILKMVRNAQERSGPFALMQKQPLLGNIYI
jgi:hypothetical protein